MASLPPRACRFACFNSPALHVNAWPRLLRHFCVLWLLWPLASPANGDTAAAAPGTNLVVNGDFELGPFSVGGMVSNWIVSGTARVASLASEGATNGTHAACLDEGGNTQGNIISQTITTVPGRSYAFEFDSGVFGKPDGNLQLRFQVFGNTSQVDETLPPPVINSYDPAQMEFHHYFRVFTADSTSTTVRFTDVGLGNANADVVVDAVSVVAMPSPTPAPTPATLPLVNGNFESWPFNYPGNVAGWTVAGNKHIECISQGATSPIHSAGFSVGGSSTGNILSQTFFTIPGQTYMLDFDSGVYGLRDGSPLQLQAQIVGTSPLFSVTVTPPDASTTHPAFVSFQHYHYTFSASGTQATIQFTDLVGNNASADLMLDSVSVLPVPPTFLQWQVLNFTAAQRGDPNVSGWTADPDGDGIENGLEYYFHTSPTAGVTGSEAAFLPQTGLMSEGAAMYLTFSYRRLLGWSGNAPVVAISGDLVNWDTTQSQIEQVGAAARVDGLTEIVTVRLKMPLNAVNARKYFRLMLGQ